MRGYAVRCDNCSKIDFAARDQPPQRLDGGPRAPSPTWISVAVGDGHDTYGEVKEFCSWDCLYRHADGHLDQVEEVL